LQFIAIIHWEEVGWMIIVNLIMLVGLIVCALATPFQLAAEKDAHQLSRNGQPEPLSVPAFLTNLII
jgi:hypothetical protein